MGDTSEKADQMRGGSGPPHARQRRNLATWLYDRVFPFFPVMVFVTTPPLRVTVSVRVLPLRPVNERVSV